MSSHDEIADPNETKNLADLSITESRSGDSNQFCNSLACGFALTIANPQAAVAQSLLRLAPHGLTSSNATV